MHGKAWSMNTVTASQFPQPWPASASRWELPCMHSYVSCSQPIFLDYQPAVDAASSALTRANVLIIPLSKY